MGQSPSSQHPLVGAAWTAAKIHDTFWPDGIADYTPRRIYYVGGVPIR